MARRQQPETAGTNEAIPIATVRGIAMKKGVIGEGTFVIIPVTILTSENPDDSTCGAGDVQWDSFTSWTW